jgi:hypothetical protein
MVHWMWLYLCFNTSLLVGAGWLGLKLFDRCLGVDNQIDSFMRKNGAIVHYFLEILRVVDFESHSAGNQELTFVQESRSSSFIANSEPPQSQMSFAPVTIHLTCIKPLTISDVSKGV